MPYGPIKEAVTKLKFHVAHETRAVKDWDIKSQAEAYETLLEYIETELERIEKII